MDEKKTRRELREAQAAPPAPARRKKRKSVAELILQDILLTGLILVIFALFHHVIPYVKYQMTAKQEGGIDTTPIRPSVTETAAPETGRPQETEALPADTEQPDPDVTPEPTPEPTPDPMDWRTKFADHFTEEVVVTDHSYSSPNISIDIQKYVSDDPAPSTYFVADIYVADLACFQTYWAGGSFHKWMEEDPIQCARNAGAILAINGDYANSQDYGFLVRNGELYMSEQTIYDICVLYYDGTMVTYGADEYKVQDVLDREPYQVWKFGPALLDENGQPRESFNATGPISDVNPRTGLGYYEPGHYCFVVVDGRQGGYSAGMRIGRFAQLFADLGCTAAYNLDGGRSSVMMFQNSFFNHPYLNGRNAGDILLIREIGGEEG